MPATFVIDGDRIHDIASFHAEIDRVFMAGEDWTLGQSLDALDDMLYGGYGALQGQATPVLVWRNFAASGEALGVDETRRWLQAKLEDGRYDAVRIRRELAALAAGTGQTYLARVEEVIAGHPRIVLIKC